MAVALLQQQHTQLIKQREELIFQLDLKYNNYIHTLLQQKLTITAQITNKYDQLINNVNDSIYNKISTNMNDFMERQIVNATHISNSLQQTEETSESLTTTDGNINNQTAETIIHSNHNQASNITPDPFSLESTQLQTKTVPIKQPPKQVVDLMGDLFDIGTTTATTQPVTNTSGGGGGFDDLFGDLGGSSGGGGNAYNGPPLTMASLRNIKQFKIKNSSKHPKNSTSPKRRSQRLQFRNSSNPKPFLFTKHKCSECNVLFSCQKKLANHMRAHLKEKRFICTGCGKKYQTQYALNKHEKIHKVNCSDCPEWYFSKEDLKKHILTHFIFKCNECSKSFKRKFHLDYHIKVHSFFKSHHLEPPCLEPPT